jgi:hypothetical protein
MLINKRVKESANNVSLLNLKVKLYSNYYSKVEGACSKRYSVY